MLWMSDDILNLFSCLYRVEGQINPNDFTWLIFFAFSLKMLRWSPFHNVLF